MGFSRKPCLHSEQLFRRRVCVLVQNVHLCRSDGEGVKRVPTFFALLLFFHCQPVSLSFYGATGGI